MPMTGKDIVGHEAAVEKVRKHLAGHKHGQKPLLLAGKPGIGKTSIVHALAYELDIELLEVNASDSRNKDAIETIIGGASVQQSLFFRPKAILIDEVDGVSGQKDRGSISALVAIIAKSCFPLIFTANDIESDKMKPLLKVCEVIELDDLTHEHVLQRLTHIAKTEGVKVDKEQLSAISRRCGGDLRAAINDMQSIGGDTITKEDVALLDERETREQVEAALMRVFKTTSAEVALPAFDNVDEDIDKLILWMEENIPREYKNPEDLARALDALAEADRFAGRIRRWQYYRFYVYMYNLLSAGVALAKDKKYPGATEYKRSGRLLKIWIYNQKNAKRKKLSETLAPQLHTSSKRVRNEVLPYLKAAMQKNKVLKKAVIEQYGLDTDAAEYFEK
jgi:replication factor C large subunit